MADTTPNPEITRQVTRLSREIAALDKQRDAIAAERVTKQQALDQLVSLAPNALPSAEPAPSTDAAPKPTVKSAK